MYPIENSGDLVKNKQKQLLRREMWMGVGSNVIFLGLTSLLTDISSEMVTATLPLNLLLTLRLVPLQFGLTENRPRDRVDFFRPSDLIIRCKLTAYN